MSNIIETAGVPVEITPTLPEMNLASRDVEGWLEELRLFHICFGPLFLRQEQRHWSRKYLEGLLLEIPNKAIEPMAERLKGGNVRAMQQFIGAGAWDDGVILKQHQRLVDGDLGEPKGVLIVDDSGFPKQGEYSVGVKRQRLASPHDHDAPGSFLPRPTAIEVPRAGTGLDGASNSLSAASCAAQEGIRRPRGD